jgi:hypothetical protein
MPGVLREDAMQGSKPVDGREDDWLDQEIASLRKSVTREADPAQERGSTARPRRRDRTAHRGSTLDLRKVRHAARTHSSTLLVWALGTAAGLLIGWLIASFARS